jgi:hypothetical protein
MRLVFLAVTPLRAFSLPPTKMLLTRSAAKAALAVEPHRCREVPSTVS